MAVCSKCNTTILDCAKFCANCGTPYIDGLAQDSSSMATGSVNNESTLMAILGYIIFFVPLLVEYHKKSSFVRFHVNQGTVLFITYVLGAICFVILAMVCSFLRLNVGIIATLSTLFVFGVFVLTVMGVINVLQGKTKPLPIIGGYTVIK